MIFLPENLDDFVAWQSAVGSYVIQSTLIEENFNFLDKLGRGSFGYVLLAEPKSKLLSETIKMRKKESQQLPK